MLSNDQINEIDLFAAQLLELSAALHAIEPDEMSVSHGDALIRQLKNLTCRVDPWRITTRILPIRSRAHQQAFKARFAAIEADMRQAVEKSTTNQDGGAA